MRFVYFMSEIKVRELRSSGIISAGERKNPRRRRRSNKKKYKNRDTNIKWKN